MSKKGTLKKIDMNKLFYALLLTCLAFVACENREVNHADGPNFNIIHEEINSRFDEIQIDGNDYYILERDRNNPHEGFGFMALNGSKLIANQDSIKAYLRTMMDLQMQILANTSNTKLSEIEAQTNSKINDYLKITSQDLSAGDQ